ncbi:MAG TPA: hypothetical protein GXX40_09985 [Firmicutes bacterium]|nr:hypothetical protein [Bacillota bacterium]
MEPRAIPEALRQTGVVKSAARRLRISERCLRSKLKEYLTAGVIR